MPTDRQTRFLVLEGLDGAGTTTQARLCADALRKGSDLRVHLTAEPSDGPLGRVARAHVKGQVTLDPLTAALAFSADRADHLTREILPALGRGEWVVCDRYLLSTLAYQGAEGVDREWICEISRDFAVPGLTVFLDLPHAERQARMSRRAGTDRYEAPELADPLRTSYLESIEMLRARGHEIAVVDGAREPETVASDVLGRLDVTGSRS